MPEFYPPGRFAASTSAVVASLGFLSPRRTLRLYWIDVCRRRPAALPYPEVAPMTLRPRPPFALLLLLLLSGWVLADGPKRGPFTQPQRSLRSRNFDQRHVRLELQFDWDAQRIDGRALLTLKPFRPIRSVGLDAAEMKIVKASLASPSKEPLKFTHRGNRLEVELGREVAADAELQLDIQYEISNPKNGAHFVLPGEKEPNQTRMVWTQSEPEYARYWFPCHDHPSDRFTSEILATVPEGYVVLSNGALQEKKPADGGKVTWHFVQEPEHVSYLMSVVAGEFEVYEQSWDGLPVTSYVPKGRLDQAARSFSKTARMVEYYSDLFGYRYPWAKYSQICVDEYGWGGMEHTSATTLNLNTLHDERAELDTSSESLVAHELVHQWFGDLITCKDWSQIWLNESFATYFTTVWYEHEFGADEAAWRRYEEAQSYKTEDTKRYRRALVTSRYDKPVYMFDRHSYPKGARVLHMLRYVLGDDAFWRTIRHYTNKCALQSVETAQFRIALEEATGQGLDWFFDQWVYHGGHPQYDLALHLGQPAETGGPHGKTDPDGRRPDAPVPHARRDRPRDQFGRRDSQDHRGQGRGDLPVRPGRATRARRLRSRRLGSQGRHLPQGQGRMDRPGPLRPARHEPGPGGASARDDEGRSRCEKSLARCCRERRLLGGSAGRRQGSGRFLGR